MRGNHYFLDTSALVAAWEERYPIELFPEVWDFINSLGNRVRVCEEVEMKLSGTLKDCYLGLIVRQLSLVCHFQR